MSGISIRKISITDIHADAVVNAANSCLQAGGGVCGAIFKAAGYSQLQDACDAIGHCDTGKAVITPAFGMKNAKYIIHAVGPIWRGGHHHEPQLLYSAYQSSLELAAENGCESIAFPLISAGIFGYPLKDAWRKAIQACKDFQYKNPNVKIDIIFAVLDDKILEEGRYTLHVIEVNEADVAGLLKIYGPDGKGLETAEEKKKDTDSLFVYGRTVDAVYFHDPDGENGYLSNWYKCGFVLDGIHFSSAEQYIMYKKCMLFGDTASAKMVLDTDDTQEQQNIGRHAHGYIQKVWEGSRQVIALQGLMAKFTQCVELKQKLLNTGDAWLVECAGSDRIWACGLKINDPRRYYAANWEGTNILGFALMEVRELLSCGYMTTMTSESYEGGRQNDQRRTEKPD